MRVLVTNDDGWAAPGLSALVGMLSAAGHEVQVAAPNRERSGSGTAVGCLDDGYEFDLEEVEVPGAAGAWALDAPPAMCVITGLSGRLGARPDVVLSGINAGYNTGRNLVHSGTFGAAWMAARFGFPAAAISASALPDARFDTAARVAVELLDDIVSLQPGLAANINVPDLDHSDLSPAVETVLARSGMQRVDIERAGDRIRVSELPVAGSEGDTSAVLEGRVSVTVVEARLRLGSIPAGSFGVDQQPTSQETTV